MNTIYPKLIIEEKTPKSNCIVAKGREYNRQVRALIHQLADTKDDRLKFESTLKIRSEGSPSNKQKT